MSYNTMNQIGSTDSRDRADNSENFDIFENSTTKTTHTDRLGNTRTTRFGMEEAHRAQIAAHESEHDAQIAAHESEHDAQIAAHESEHDAQIAAHESEHDAQIAAHESEFKIKMAGMAFSRVGSFAAGYSLTDSRQTLEYSGHDYGWAGTFPKVVAAGATPATSGGIGAGAWVDRTDVTLRSEIKASNSSSFSIDISVKDAARQAVEGATGGKVTIMYDAEGNPNYMVRIPKFNIQDVDATLGTGVHPAFIVNGVEKSEIWIGQHVGSLVNGVLCSLPGKDPANSMTFDEAVTYCRNKGAGWHLMTNAEWAAIKLWCLKNGFLPRGNSNYGRSSDATYETGTRVDGRSPGDTSGTPRVLTGTGPASWRHNNDFAGIADLAGNVWEWASGLRLNNGEIQVLANNDAALATADLSSASADWRAISMTDGSLVLPGSAGTAKFDSDAVATSGTGSLGAFTLSNVIANRQGPVDDSTNNYQYNTQTFEASKVKAGLTAPAILKALGLYPHATGYGSDVIYMRNYGERLPIAGGGWYSGASAGVFALGLHNPRSNRSGDLGARPAFIA